MALKWEFSVCLLGLWLLLVPARGDMDIRPELPEDFPQTTTEPATEPAQAATEPATTTAAAVDTTTSKAAETTTGIPTTAAASTSTPSSAPGKPSPKPPSLWHSLPHLISWLWENAENGGSSSSSEGGSEELMCYLKDQEHQSYYRSRCGHTGWKPTTSCYRCCYYGYSGFAGCSKLHEGRCSRSPYPSWLL